MMGTADPQPSMFYHINLEQYVTADHPMRKIRPLINTARIRQLCEPLYAETGRPSIPPEPLFLALLGGYLLGVTSERALVRELTGNLVLRWFVGLDLDQTPWDHSTFSQNRTRRFTESGLLERLFDETVARALTHKRVSHHTTLDGTLGQANASHQSFVPMEVFLKPEEYKRPDSLAGYGRGARTGPGESYGHVSRRAALESDAYLDHRSGRRTGEQGQWDGGHGGLYRQWIDGEPASASPRHQCRNVPRARFRDGRRAAHSRRVSLQARATHPHSGRGQGVFCQAVSDGSRATTDPPAHCR